MTAIWKIISKPIFGEKGFLPIPIILIVLLVTGVGSYTVVNVAKDYVSKEIHSENKNIPSEEEANQSLPEGTAASEEIIVKFKDNVNAQKRNEIHQNVNAQTKKNIHQLNIEVIKLNPGKSVQDALNDYKSKQEVEFVEPNFLASAFVSPNDPLYNNQWNLKKVLAEDAFTISQGGGTVVAVIDTGVDSSHSDLQGLVMEGYNAIDGSTNTLDDNSHGTHVAGITSAQTGNGTGVASISYQAKILPIKVLDSSGVGNYADVAEGIVTAADRGARIINMSLGGSSDSQTLRNAVGYAQSRGSIIVASAGNNGSSDAMYPASYSGVLAVAASDQNDNLASFSNFGNNIFVASPGVSIVSSVPGNGYKSYNGTSMAAPHLSGLLALELSYKSTLTNSELIDQIKKNAEKVGPSGYDQNGWNPYFGYGRISAGKTLKSIAESTTSATPIPIPAPDSEKDQKSRPEKPTRSKHLRNLNLKQESFQLQGEVDSVTVSEAKLTVKVTGGSKELEVFKGNLVDLYINGDSVLRSQNHGIQLSEIGQNAKLHVTGLNNENKLFIIEAQIIQTNSNSGISSGNNNGNGNTTTNSASNQQEASQQNIQSSNNTSDNSQKSENPGNGNSEAAPNNEKSNNGRGQGNVKGVSTNYFDYLLQNIKYFFNFN